MSLSYSKDTHMHMTVILKLCDFVVTLTSTLYIYCIYWPKKKNELTTCKFDILMKWEDHQDNFFLGGGCYYNFRYWLELMTSCNIKFLLFLYKYDEWKLVPYFISGVILWTRVHLSYNICFCQMLINDDILKWICKRVIGAFDLW